MKKPRSRKDRGFFVRSEDEYGLVADFFDGVVEGAFRNGYGDLFTDHLVQEGLPDGGGGGYLAAETSASRTSTKV